MLTEKTRIILPSNIVEPRESHLDPLSEFWQEPQAGKAEQVYFHSDLQTTGKLAKASICNPEFPLGSATVNLHLDMIWDTSNLPELIEWYMPGCITHALGIEPANCRVMGRSVEKEEGRLVYLEPGEKKGFRIFFNLRNM